MKKILLISIIMLALTSGYGYTEMGGGMMEEGKEMMKEGETMEEGKGMM
jgi:hypothetical protein